MGATGWGIGQGGLRVRGAVRRDKRYDFVFLTDKAPDIYLEILSFIDMSALILRQDISEGYIYILLYFFN
jgi:hypothetical protein